MRVVFDCAAKYENVSLNSKLLSGPNLTNNLLGVLLRFREKPIVLVADIECMFYAVRTQTRDRDFMRFLWWPEGDVTKTPEVFRMCVFLFGATCSPACAISALRATAKDNESLFSQEAIDTVLRKSYMDDFLSSVVNEDIGIQLVRELRDLCKLGGFRLTKWLSNSKAVLETIPEEEKAAGVRDLDMSKEALPIERTLGLSWNADKDVFSFKIDIPELEPTRRGILSMVSRIYDPLGLVTPFVLPAKLVLQELCKKGFDWDSTIPEVDLQNWQLWRQNLHQLENMEIERCLNPLENDAKHELHVFCDASEKAYCAVAYLRVVTEAEVKCTLVMSKSRVTPIGKKITIPRLELTSCKLGVELAKIIENEMDVTMTTYYWTDSMSALRYISNDKARYHTFVANRVHFIREGSDVNQWNYIKSENNPADMGTRGLSPGDSAKTEAWLRGPSFLTELGECMGSSIERRDIPDDDPEVKQSVNAVTTKQNDTGDDEFDSFSDWKRLRRVMAWVMKFYVNLRRKVKERKQAATNEEQIEKEKLILTKDDLQRSEMLIFKTVQQKHFKSEISQISGGKTVPRKNKLRKLDPVWIDGILRVGGRLSRSSLEYESKHPIIMPKESHVSKLLLEFAHKSSGHLG